MNLHCSLLTSLGARWFAFTKQLLTAYSSLLIYSLMWGSLFHLPAGFIICFAQIRPFLRFLETSLGIPIILSSEADISSSRVKFCAKHQQRVDCFPCLRAGFQFFGVGCFFFSFCLKINLKHLSVWFSGSTMSFCDPSGTGSFRIWNWGIAFLSHNKKSLRTYEKSWDLLFICCQGLALTERVVYAVLSLSTTADLTNPLSVILNSTYALSPPYVFKVF